MKSYSKENPYYLQFYHSQQTFQNFLYLFEPIQRALKWNFPLPSQLMFIVCTYLYHPSTFLYTLINGPYMFEYSYSKAKSIYEGTEITQIKERDEFLSGLYYPSLTRYQVKQIWEPVKEPQVETIFQLRKFLLKENELELKIWGEPAFTEPITNFINNWQNTNDFPLLTNLNLLKLRKEQLNTKKLETIIVVEEAKQPENWVVWKKENKWTISSSMSHLWKLQRIVASEKIVRRFYHNQFYVSDEQVFHPIKLQQPRKQISLL